MRERIGKATSLVTRDLVYLTDEGFEIESHEGYEIVERRVLFDDVQLVTYHRRFGALYLAVTGVLALLFLGTALAVAASSTDGWVAAIVVAMFGVPALIAFLLRLAFRIDVITIFGRRSKARIHFRLRKRKAREVYGRICAAVRHAQSVRSAADGSSAPPSS